MTNSERRDQLKQLSIFVGVMAILVLGLYGLTRIIKDENEDYQSLYTVQVGNAFVINVPGRVSIEYRWQINKQKSKGLKLIKISHIGWVYPKDNASSDVKAKTGAPRTAKFYIQAIAPGIVQLALEFKRRGIEDDTPIRSRDITLNITP